MFTVVVYNKNYRKIWNNFINESKNATFLHYRNYIEYHSDKFIDHSLLIYNEKNILMALFPANIENNVLISHSGLTYGGILTNHTISTIKVLQIFETIICYCNNQNINIIIYKTIPHIYHKSPSEEDLYALFRCKFHLFRRDVSSTLNMKTNAIKGKKQNGFRRASSKGMIFVETSDSNNVLKIANNNLRNKYGLNTVHSVEEMNYLKGLFSDNIRIFEVIHEGKVIGGAILFLANRVVHAQYLFTTNDSKKMRSLDFLVVSCINKFSNEYRWFDFGISTENNGKVLNNNLIKSKEEFGFSAVCYEQYSLIINES